MVDIAQMVERRIVAPSVVGSIPTIHPKQGLGVMVTHRSPKPLIGVRLS